MYYRNWLFPPSPIPGSTQRGNPNNDWPRTKDKTGVVDAPWLGGGIPAQPNPGKGNSVKEPGTPWAEPDRAPHPCATHYC